MDTLPPRRLASACRLSLALVAVLLSGCDSAETFEVGGTYVFESGPDAFGVTRFASLTLPTTASGDRLAFSYEFRESTSEGSEQSQGTGAGRYDHPTLTLTLDGSATTGSVSPDGSRIVIDGQDTPPFTVYIRQSAPLSGPLVP